MDSHDVMKTQFEKEYLVQALWKLAMVYIIM